MDPQHFEASSAGRPIRTFDGAWAFVPKPLPPDINIAPLTGHFEQAAGLIGELRGIATRLPNPLLLIPQFQRREALASSSIEGTVTTLTDLFLFQAAVDEKALQPDTREVHNYVQALQHAIRRLPDLPLSLRLIRELHAILMADVPQHRGAGIVPGEFRKDQNWIGGRSATTARFVPAPANLVPECLDAFERYLNPPPDDRTPKLLRAALAHYQFETIHPFPDGNGRVGRILIPLMMMNEGVLNHPLLYISPYFEQHKDKYIDCLYRVSRDGNWLDWLELFLNAVSDQAQDTVVRIESLLELERRYVTMLGRARSSALTSKLVAHLFGQLVISIPGAADVLGITYHAAKAHVDRLVEIGVLFPIVQRANPKLYVARGILNVLNASDPRKALDPIPATE